VQELCQNEIGFLKKEVSGTMSEAEKSVLVSIPAGDIKFTDNFSHGVQRPVAKHRTCVKLSGNKCG
jgi:hypothetical protein